MRAAMVMVLLGLSACGRDEPPPEPPVVASAQPSATATAAPVACEPGCASIEHCEAGACVPACPEGEVYIEPTGPEGFSVGIDHSTRDKRHRIVLTKPFCMDATEVTVKAYRACVEAKKCEAPRQWGMWINYPKLDDHPVNKVHFNHATAYCAFREQALPTEAQWEWAARGRDGHKWAWGDEEPTCEHADFTPGELRSGSSDDGCHGGGTSPVGAHPKGDRKTKHGVLHDLSGNVWEWCRDNYLPYSGQDETDPLHEMVAGNAHVVRGGGWNRSGKGIRVDFRGGSAVDYQVPGLGFRCVRNPK
jgi:formylglycine-generating enzyme required for sulfatase activity